MIGGDGNMEYVSYCFGTKIVHVLGRHRGLPLQYMTHILGIFMQEILKNKNGRGF